MKIPLCLTCQTNQAQYKAPYGYLPCISCQTKQRAYKIPKPAIELATNDMQMARKEYRDDTLQRFRGGTPSLEYISKYGVGGFSREEVKNARNVCEEDYYVDKEMTPRDDILPPE